MVLSVLGGMTEAIIPASEEVATKFQEEYGESPTVPKVMAVIEVRSRGALLTSDKSKVGGEKA